MHKLGRSTPGRRLAPASATQRAVRAEAAKGARSPIVDGLTIRPVTKADWLYIAELFGDKGACGGCWCMYWRVARGGREWDDMRGPPARLRFQNLVQGGNVHGLLAFLVDRPIGWVCIGPYAAFPRLERVRAFERDRPVGTWSIVCFYIPPDQRQSRLATRLLIAARDLALERGATIVEGYPVTVRSKQGLPGAFAWTGVPRMFREAGFHRLGSSEQSRHVWVAAGSTSSHT